MAAPAAKSTPVMNRSPIKRLSPLRGTRKVQNDIDLFFDKVGDATTLFSRLVKEYLRENGPSDHFNQTLDQLVDIERGADELRRGIESYLYEKTLIPDLRSDVLALIEEVDGLLSPQIAVSYALRIEQPDIPAVFHNGFVSLIDSTTLCVEHLLRGARAFFRDTVSVRDHSHKVVFEESQADKLCTELKVAIFASDLDKVEKIHLRYFIERIDLLANRAEDIADALTIYAIKRMF